MAIPNQPSGLPTQPRPMVPVINPLLEEDDETLPPQLPKVSQLPIQEELRLPTKTSNPWDEDDNPFTAITAADPELYEEDDDEDEEPVFTPKRIVPIVSENPSETVLPATRKPIEVVEGKKPSKLSRFKTDKKPSLKEGFTEDTFVDEKEMKLKPFGGGKHKAKVSEFDDRNNLRKRAKVIQYIVLGLIFALVGLGVKNAFFPPKTLSAADVTTIVTNNVGDMGFPLDRGRGFAKDFMQSFLTINSSDPLNDRVLGYYYSGRLQPLGSDTSRILNSSDIRQHILTGPTVYEAKALTAYSARFVVGALVTSSLKDVPAPSDGSTAKWMFFSVNVYYDVKTDSMLVTPDSPSVVAPLDVAASSSVPAEAKVGNGNIDQNLTDAVQSVVIGYLKGYAISSQEDHTAIDQYIIPNPPVALLKGLDKRYTLAGDDGSMITANAYATSVPGEVKVEVTVKWRDSVASNAQVDYSSVYIMTLEKQSNGKYLVAKFAPKYYVKSAE